jgi:hypothetical protein
MLSGFFGKKKKSSSANSIMSNISTASAARYVPTPNFIRVQLPLSDNDRMIAEGVFDLVQKKINMALLNLTDLLARLTPEYAMQKQSFRGFIQQAQRVYHEVDRQRMIWLPALRKKKNQGVKQVITLPNFPLKPLAVRQQAVGIKYHKNHTLSQATPNIQRMFNYIGQQYGYMDSVLPQKVNPRDRVMQLGKPARFAFLRKVLSSGLLPKRRR